MEQAAEIFVGIIHDLNQSAPEIRWLAVPAEPQNEIIRRVRQSLAAGPAPADPLPATPRPPDSLLVKSLNRQQFLKLSEVKALLADGEYSTIHWGLNQHMMFRKPLKQWAAELPPEQFVRVHRQTIVNLAWLDFVEKTPEGKPLIHLREFKPVIPVSQRETPHFNRCLKKIQAR